LKSKATDGLNEGGSYHPVLAFKSWGDHSGGPYGQLTTTSTGNLYYRHSTSETAWSGWYNVAVQNKDNAFVGDNTFTGIIKILSTNDAGVGSESGALRIGTMTGNHLSLDDNEIMAKSNASTASTLYLNNEGGLVQVGSGGLSTSGTITAPTFAGNATTASSTPMLSCSNSSAADSVDDVLTSSASLRLHKASAAMYNNNDGLVLTASWSGSYGAQLWLDDGGGEGGMAIRNRKSDGWNPWRQILSSGNFNSYAPKLDGTGASGTWGINITGNATTANSATYASSAGDLYTGSVSGDTHAAALKSWFDTYKNSTVRNHLLSFYSSAYGNGSQYMGYFLNGYNDTPYGGFFVAHYTTPYYVGIQYGEYTQWELSKVGHTHSYLPLTGGTMSGGIDMANSDITNINNLTFSDPGANEGISWTGGNGWAIYESPDNLTNGAGNL
jgi:hypothetical protein